MSHPLGAQSLALSLVAMIQDDRHRRAPTLYLIHPIAECGQWANHHERAIDILRSQMSEQPDGLHLQGMSLVTQQAGPWASQPHIRGKRRSLADH